MSIREVASWLVENPGFRGQLHDVTIDYVSHQFEHALTRSNGAAFQKEHDWQYLLLCASLLAESDRGIDQDAALRIAHACLELNGKDVSHDDAAATVLDKLANRVAIALAEDRQHLSPGIEARLPTPLRIEWTRNYYDHSVQANGERIPVNRFQKKLWNTLAQKRVVSASAPTATGKSYLLINWIGNLVAENPSACIVYLVPTRALISEVERKLKTHFQAKDVADVNVTSVPSIDALQLHGANVLVFTQERLQILLVDRPDFPISVLIVDEAHKVGDGQRGVLLQQVVEDVETENENVRVVYSSPLTEDPSVLLVDAQDSGSSASIASEDVTVNQNLIWASQIGGRPREWTAELMLDGEGKSLGKFELPSIPSPESKRLSFVAFALAKDSPGNVVYANGAAAAEKTAGHLHRLLSDISPEDEPELHDLIDLVRKTIHRDYLLATVLERGVAFHYGNMPLLIKTEIERLFTKNVIRYLVCTSTLVEGVNMACKSIFLRGPQKGRGRPMNREDFWNLAGRAGRWGHDFQGNVICVDAKVERLWSAGEAPRSRGTYPIHRTADDVLLRPADLIDFLKRDTPREVATKRPDLEYVASYLMSRHFSLGGIQNAPWASRLDQEDLGVIASLIEKLAHGLAIPETLVHRNPGISPIALDSLLRYFRTREGSPEQLVPVHPASEDSAAAYNKIFARIYKHIGSPLGPGGRSFMLAILVTDWMRGYSLARLIEHRAAYHRKRNTATRLPTIIRNVMEDVEKIARFEAPKSLAAYNDVLGVHLTEIGRQDLLDLIPDVSLLLEFGVSQTTQISMMSLGLSRTTAIELSELIIDDSLGKTDALRWLHDREWETADLPAIVKREVDEMLSINKQQAK